MEFNINLRFCRVWGRPEPSEEFRKLGFELDKQGSFEINLIWYHIVFMYY